MDHYNGYTTEGKSVSHVVQSDHERLHFNRIESREFSVGQSSRVYYRNPEGVPFKWEMQPGKPKIINLPREEVIIIPPPSPPPAVQSLWLPKPNCVDQPNKKWKRWSISRLWLWKKISKKNQQVYKVERGDLAADFSSNIAEHSSTYYNQGRTASANKNDVVLFKGILSKNPSANQSCRLYYRNPGGVPFKWEMFPGTSKNPAVEEIIIPPPSPPPAVQSLGYVFLGSEFNRKRPQPGIVYSCF